MSTPDAPGQGQERPDTPPSRLLAREVEDLLLAVEREALPLFAEHRVDEAEASELLLDLLRALACDRRPGDPRARFLAALGRAIHARWAEQDPLEDDDVVH